MVIDAYHVITFRIRYLLQYPAVVQVFSIFAVLRIGMRHDVVNAAHSPMVAHLILTFISDYGLPLLPVFRLADVALLAPFQIIGAVVVDVAVLVSDVWQVVGVRDERFGHQSVNVPFSVALAFDDQPHL